MYPGFYFSLQSHPLCGACPTERLVLRVTSQAELYTAKSEISKLPASHYHVLNGRKVQQKYKLLLLFFFFLRKIRS